ncbi:MAG: GTP-binding protein [Marinosulfonomonas sp.]|nr:MAG: GTP-binding protein [Marinosulfonomonas sp.]
MKPEETRLRLTILGGFLGAGKSTWLRHQLFVKTYDQPYVIVNEVATHAVDDTLLAGAFHLDVLAGGCVCCDLKHQMITLLNRICNDRSQKQDRPSARQLIFEMSGVADPAQVMAAIQDDPILSRNIILEEIIVVVDALHGLEQLRTEFLSRRQIEAADRIFITKADVPGVKNLGTLLATLRQLNPGPDIQSCAFGVEVPMPSTPISEPLPLPYLDSADDEPLSSLLLNLDEYSVDGDFWVGFSVWLSAMLHSHGDRMVRVKGVVRTPTGRLLLQSVRKVMQTPEILPNEGDRSSDNTIVLIGRGMEPERIERSLRHIVAKEENPNNL